MIKLLNANFHELLKSKHFWLTICICAFIGVLMTAGMYLYPKFNMPENSDIILTKDNILSYMPSFCALIIPFAGAATVAFELDTQFRHGIIRNMLICGHTRTDVFFSNLITVITATVIYFISYQTAVFSVAIFAFEHDGFQLKAALISLIILLVMVIGTGTVFSFVVGNFLRGGKTTIVILTVQYFMNMSIFLGMVKKDNVLLNIAARAFPQSSLFDFSYSVTPDGIEKNLIAAVALIAGLIAVGLCYFRKCDIK